MSSSEPASDAEGGAARENSNKAGSIGSVDALGNSYSVGNNSSSGEAKEDMINIAVLEQGELAYYGDHAGFEIFSRSMLNSEELAAVDAKKAGIA